VTTAAAHASVESVTANRRGYAICHRHRNNIITKTRGDERDRPDDRRNARQKSHPTADEVYNWWCLYYSGDGAGDDEWPKGKRVVPSSVTIIRDTLLLIIIIEDDTRSLSPDALLSVCPIIVMVSSSVRVSRTTAIIYAFIRRKRYDTNGGGKNTSTATLIIWRYVMCTRQWYILYYIILVFERPDYTLYHYYYRYRYCYIPIRGPDRFDGVRRDSIGRAAESATLS